MAEEVEVRKGDSVTSLVDELATAVTPDTLALPVDRPIAKGEWVRFALRLLDGTDVLEGVGRSRGSIPRGNPVSHHDLVLSDLQLDERNEIMWERLLIAAESAMSGDETGNIVLDERSLGPAQSSPTRRKPPPPAPARPKGPLGSARRDENAATPDDASHRWEVPPQLLSSARRVSARLPAATRPATDDEALALALRIGLAALEAQTSDSD